MRKAIVIVLTLLSSAAWAAHPLQTDDPGTVPPGRIEFEQAVYFAEAQGIAASSTAFTYGVTANFDAGVGVGYDFTESPRLSVPAVFTKWRFVGNAVSGFSLALGTAGLSVDSVFNSDHVALLLSEYRSETWALLLDTGRVWSRDEQDRFTLQIAAEIDATPYATFVGEVTNLTSLDLITGFGGNLGYLLGIIYTDSHGYAYSAGIRRRPDEEQSTWRFTTGITIVF